MKFVVTCGIIFVVKPNEIVIMIEHIFGAHVATTPLTISELIAEYPIKFNPFISWTYYEDWERAREFQLVVGSTVTGKEQDMGVMRIYDVPSLMEPLVLKHQMENLGNIVDITYKERVS